MTLNDEKKRFSPPKEEDDSGTGETGTTGTGTSGGQIEFRTFIGNERLRDDLLPPDEKKRLLATHKTLNENSVKKQKARFDEYQRLKDGKTSLQEFRRSGASQEYPFRPHTILENEAQFSGTNRQTTPLPNENNADTNNDKKNELQLHYQNRLENRPQYTSAPPTPSPFK